MREICSEFKILQTSLNLTFLQPRYIKEPIIVQVKINLNLNFLDLIFMMLILLGNEKSFNCLLLLLSKKC